MSVIPLKKITLCGLAKEAEKITTSLQEAGAIHVIKQNTEDYSSTAIHENIKALMYLVNCKNKLHMLKDDEEFNAETLIEEITAMRQKTIEFEEQQEILEKDIEKITPWGDFEFIPKKEIEGHKFYFYKMASYKVNIIPDDVIYSVVGNYMGEEYIIVLSETKPKNMPVRNTNIGKESLSALRTKLEDITEELDDLETRRTVLTKYRYLLAENLNNVNNEAERIEVEYSSLNDEDMFILKGYVGINKLQKIKKLAANNGFALYIEKVPNEERAPTLLKNPEKISGGEELVKFYSVPGYKSVDPSNILFFSFALFFAMILSDFGYAFILAIILTGFNNRMKKTRIGQRIRNLSWFIVLVSMIWGALVGSYFGTAPNGIGICGEIAQKFKVLDINNTDLMMKISIYIGVIHVCIANFMRAWHNKHSTFAISRIGWMFVCFSGFVYMPMIMIGEKNPENIMQIAQYVLIIGLGLVLLFSGTSKNIFKRLMEGLLGLTKVSGAFGDVLSYLRIFALGLASATLGMTSNQLAMQVIDAMPTFGYMVAIIILILGHTINFGLGIMSGVVHGLRLNVIEFFNWSVSDDGYPFNAFSKTEVKKWINL